MLPFLPLFQGVIVCKTLACFVLEQKAWSKSPYTHIVSLSHDQDHLHQRVLVELEAVALEAVALEVVELESSQYPAG